jgi:hypothetical protein
VGSGVVKATETAKGTPFYDIMQDLKPWFRVFSLSGFVLMIAVISLAVPLYEFFFNNMTRPVTRGAKAITGEGGGSVRLINTMEKEKV